MKREQKEEETQQPTNKIKEWLKSSYEWLKTEQKRNQIGERKRHKLEKKRRKQQKKRRKRINAKIDRTVSFWAIMLCFLFSALDVLERRGKLPWRRK